MVFSRRVFASSLVGLSTGLAFPDAAKASTAIELSVSDLVQESARCIVGVAVAHRSDWELVGGTRRIVTWTRVLQEHDWLLDSESEDEVEVLTLGGRVGSLTQKVSGEAALQEGQRSLLFLGSESRTIRRVIGMAQGHFPVTEGERGPSIHRSHHLAHLVQRRYSKGHIPQPRAVDALHGLLLPDAKRLIRGAR